MALSPSIMMLAAQILAGAVLLGLLYVLAKRAARWYLLRTLERRVEKVRKILEKHQASKFEKVDRLLFQLGNVQDREAVEIALHEVLENDGDRFGPRLRKIYNNIGLVDHYQDRLVHSRRWVERAEAARALGQLQVVEAIPELVARMRDSHEDVKTVKQAAAQALGRMQADEAIPLLLEELSRPDDWASPHIAEQLLGFGEKILEPLILTLAESTSTNARLWAAQILGRLEDRSATPVLIERLSDRSDRVRISVTEALGRLKDRRAIPELTRVALRDPVPMVRAEAAKSMGEIGDRSVMSELVQMMSSGDYWTRLRAVEAIEKLKPDDTSPLEQALEDESRVVRGEAARALERLGVLEKRLNDLKNPDEGRVQAATDSLVRLGKAGAVESLLRATADADPDIRALVCVVLGRAGDLYAMQVMEHLFKDDHWQVRAAAAEAVGRLRPEDAVERLVPALADRDDRVRVAAIDAIRNIRPSHLGEHLDALIELFESGGVEARRSVLGSVGAAPSDSLRDLLHQALDDPDADVRYLAVKEAGRREDVGCTVALSQRLGDSDQRVRVEAACALGREASEDGIAALVESLSTSDRDFRETLTDLLAPLGVGKILDRIGIPEEINRRLALVWALGKSGDPDALPVLAQLAEDNNPDVRSAVAGALGKIDDPRSVEILGMLVNNPEPRVRAAATNGIGHLKATEMLPVLLECTDEPSSFVLGRLAVALGLMGGEPVLAGLNKIEQRLQEPEDLALVAVGYGLTGLEYGVDRALKSLSNPDLEQAISAAMEKERPEVRSRFRKNLALDGVAPVDDFRSQKLRERYIQQLLNSRDSERRSAAIRSLQSIGIGEDTGILLKVVAADPSPQVRRTALQCLAPDYRDDRVMGALLRALRDPVGEVRIAAVNAIGQSESPEHNLAILACGTLGETAVVDAVLAALCAANQGRVAAFVEELQAVEDPAGQALGARTLGQIGDPEAQEQLAAWLLTRNIELRAASVVALGSIGTRKAGDILATCTGDPALAVRVALAEVVGEYPAVSIRDCMERLAKDPANEVRASLATHLAGRDDGAAVSVLGEFAFDPETSIRVLGLLGLLRSGGAAALGEFLELFDGQPPAVVHEVRKIPREHPAFMDLADKVTMDTDPDTRVAALEALMVLDKLTPEPVRAGLQDPEPVVRLAAIEAAPMVDDPEVREMLGRLMDDPDATVRQQVRRGKLRIIKG
ncbi:MAG: HEAT repeat domain-containing protein [Acidobacteria bacterium]|uniref:HEAT repeat domain-containing protein n=1 Tax=Candidatus Polarisedimenticola svalbardensis TaxID=2886004 RepID=A0A8J6Y5Y7_9BACT|nr:HEAT repeat domain-containing protein [Candidatus Polarisedimenticola svalbardensis]